MNNETGADLWPQKGDWLRYIMADTTPYYPDEPRLTCQNEYRVEQISFVTAGDRIKVIDDDGNLHWIPLYMFSFIDQREEFNK